MDLRNRDTETLTRALISVAPAYRASGFGPRPSGVQSGQRQRGPPCKSLPSFVSACWLPVGITSRKTPMSRENQEHRQVTAGVHRRRRRCHGWSSAHERCVPCRVATPPPPLASTISSTAPKRVRGGRRPQRWAVRPGRRPDSQPSRPSAGIPLDPVPIAS